MFKSGNSELNKVMNDLIGYSTIYDDMTVIELKFHKLGCIKTIFGFHQFKTTNYKQNIQNQINLNNEIDRVIVERAKNLAKAIIESKSPATTISNTNRIEEMGKLLTLVTPESFTNSVKELSDNFKNLKHEKEELKLENQSVDLVNNVYASVFVRQAFKECRTLRDKKFTNGTFFIDEIKAVEFYAENLLKNGHNLRDSAPSYADIKSAMCLNKDEDGANTTYTLPDGRIVDEKNIFATNLQRQYNALNEECKECCDYLIIDKMYHTSDIMLNEIGNIIYNQAKTENDICHFIWANTNHTTTENSEDIETFDNCKNSENEILSM